MISTDEQLEFLSTHRRAVPATGRRDGSSQQPLVAHIRAGQPEKAVSHA